MLPMSHSAKPGWAALLPGDSSQRGHPEISLPRGAPLRHTLNPPLTALELRDHSCASLGRHIVPHGGRTASPSLPPPQSYPLRYLDQRLAVFHTISWSHVDLLDHP